MSTTRNVGTSSGDGADNPDVTFAEDTVPRALVLAVTVATVIFSTLLCLIAWGLLRLRLSALVAAGAAVPMGAPSSSPSGAPHQVAGVRQELFELHRHRPTLAERQREALSRQAWVDKQRGLVSIPIEQAIDLVVAEQGRAMPAEPRP